MPFRLSVAGSVFLNFWIDLVQILKGNNQTNEEWKQFMKSSSLQWLIQYTLIKKHRNLILNGEIWYVSNPDVLWEFPASRW